MIGQRFWFAAFTLLIGTVFAAAAHAQACPGKGAMLTGTLRVESHQHPNGTTFRPWILQMANATCLMAESFGERSGLQRTPNIRRVQLGSSSDQQESQLKGLVGKTITIRLDDIFQPHTAWHVGDVVSTQFEIVRQ